MRVLLNSALLAGIANGAIPLAGIGRVTDQLAKGLAASDECLLTLVSFGLLSDAAGLVDYTASNASLARAAVAAGPALTSAGRAIRRAAGIGPPRTDHRWVHRLINGSFDLLDRAFCHLNRARCAVWWGSGGNYDIYHDPSYHRILRPRQNHHMREFTTVYDLLPIRYPHFFVRGVSEWLKSVIARIGPEGHVVTISEHVRQDLCEYSKIDPRRVHVTPLAADENLFFPCADAARVEEVLARYGVPRKPFVLSLATLEPRKNLDHLIRCFTRLVQQEKIEDLNLVLVGAKGWFYDTILAEMDTLGALAGRVIVTGFVPDADLAPLYSAARMFVFPSLGEGFGLPPLEAMQCGIPVITSNNTSLPEVVGNAGIMVDATDADALCHAMLDLYRDEARRSVLSQMARERAALFSWKRFTQDTLKAYRSALA